MIAKTSICIVGAGPVGSLMSVLLARRGFDVTVYERRPDMRRVDIPAGRSINLALANRGINALEKVGLMNEIGKHLIPMRGRMIHDEAGNVSLQPYGNKAEEIIYSVSRGELNKTLMNVAESAGVCIEFNQRFRCCDAVNDLAVELDVEDADPGIEFGGSVRRLQCIDAEHAQGQGHDNGPQPDHDSRELQDVVSGCRQEPKHHEEQNDADPE